MQNLLTRKLELFGPLPDDDKRFLDEIVRSPRILPPRQDIIEEGDRPEHVHLILDGFACRYKVLRQGERQIVA